MRDIIRVWEENLTFPVFVGYQTPTFPTLGYSLRSESDGTRK